jgi:hypothetical protein
MGETPLRIASRIDATRDLLYDNMQELERKVRSATDWREYTKRLPNLVTAIVIGSGILLARRVMRKG